MVAFLLFFGARGSLTSKRPINASNAIFCSDQMTNSLGLNSLYTVAFAAYSMKHEGDVKKYGKMDELEAQSNPCDLPSFSSTNHPKETGILTMVSRRSEILTKF